jgi:hypothetical protein
MRPPMGGTSNFLLYICECDDDDDEEEEEEEVG